MALLASLAGIILSCTQKRIKWWCSPRLENLDGVNASSRGCFACLLPPEMIQAVRSTCQRQNREKQGGIANPHERGTRRIDHPGSVLYCTSAVVCCDALCDPAHECCNSLPVLPLATLKVTSLGTRGFSNTNSIPCPLLRRTLKTGGCSSLIREIGA